MFHSRRFFPMTALLGLLLLAACVNGTLPLPSAAPQSAQASSLNQAGDIPTTLDSVLESADSYELVLPSPTPAPSPTVTPVATTPPITATETISPAEGSSPAESNNTEDTAKVFAVVTTSNARANLRANPNANAAIIGKGNPGDAFEVIGRSADEAWVQICCVPGAEEETAAWVSASVVELSEDVDAAAIVTADSPVSATGAVSGTARTVAVSQSPVLTNALSVAWNVNWACGSDRCTIKQCGAAVTAAVAGAPQGDLLPIEHNVTWDQACFSTDSWVFEVDRTSGRESTGQYEGNFLYGYWQGAISGEPTGVFPLSDGRGVLVYCTGPSGVEIPEGDGWLSVYEGTTCHDLKTGVLVYMRYDKRWLFTGEFEGQNYERAFFGDTETLEQRLTNTNLELSYVTKTQ